MARHIDEANTRTLQMFVQNKYGLFRSNTYSRYNVEDIISSTCNNSGISSGTTLYKGDVQSMSRIPLNSFLGGAEFTALTKLTLTHLGSRNALEGILTNRRRGSRHTENASRLRRHFQGRPESTLVATYLLAPFLCNPELLKKSETEISSELGETVKAMTDLPSTLFSVLTEYAAKGTYGGLYSKLNNIQMSSYQQLQFRNFKLGVMPGAIVDFESGRILMMVTINPEFLDYFLLHQYTNSQSALHLEIFNITVDKELYETKGKSYTKELWQLIRKGVIQATDPRIKAEAVDGKEFFNEIFNSKINDSIASIGPLEEITRNNVLQVDYLAQKRVDEILRERNIQIY